MTQHASHGAHPAHGEQHPQQHAPGHGASHGPSRGAQAGSASHTGHHAHMVADFRRRFWVSLVLTVPVLVLSPMVQMFLGLGDTIRFAGDLTVLLVVSTVVFVYGGTPFLTGLVSEARARRPGMMSLVAIATSTAYAYSAAVVLGLAGEVLFWELATLIDLMLLGHWIEMRSVMGASRALEELARLMPLEAHLVGPDGAARDVPVEELRPGDRVLVKPGEKLPVDGEVLEGSSSVNESMLTGESAPVEKKKASAVIAGSVNGEGSLVVEIRKTGRESYLSQVIDLVRQAQESRSRTQDLASRAALWLTVIALAGGAATLFAWLAFGGRGLAFALERAVTVMVIACPHALGLAVPLVVAVSTALSARSGLLIRDRAAFEAARSIDAIIFDKTGTLTEGRFAVTDVIAFDSWREEDVLRHAASVEAHSEHPIARGIVASAGALSPVSGFRAIPGKGAEGVVEGRPVAVVSPGYLAEAGLGIDDGRVAALANQGKTVTFVLVGGRPAGAVALADVLRPEAREAVSRLRRMGIRCLMLTGDNRQVAAWVAGQTGIDEVFAEVLPHEKAAQVKQVQSRGLSVAMAGDGVNDAPALAQADVGIAMGAGTDVAVEAADIVLVRSNPLDAVAILGLARATYRKMVQNLLWATGYNAFALPLAAGVLHGAGLLLSPAVGAVLMSASTVIVAVNARLLRVR